MASSYTDDLDFRHKAKRNWPVTILVLTIALFGGAAVIASAIGFPSIAGILSAYLIAIVVLLTLFAILPVYALDLLD